jgi:hypothetical protein
MQIHSNARNKVTILSDAERIVLRNKEKEGDKQRMKDQRRQTVSKTTEEKLRQGKRYRRREKRWRKRHKRWTKGRT